MATEDLTYTKMVLPTLERKGEVVIAEDMEQTIGELESHIATKIM